MKNPSGRSSYSRYFTRKAGTPYQRSKRKRNGQGNWKIIRFADDFVLMVSGDRHHAEALREEVTALLAPLGLRLAPEKTRVVHIDEGFDFLGHHIRRQRKQGTSKHYVYTKPSKKAIRSIKDKVSEKTYRSTRHMELDELLRSLAIRIAQRILAMAAAIWHNNKTGASVTRSLIAYDH